MTVHEMKKLLRDIHAETGALDRPVPLFVETLERRKQLVELLLFDANAGVLHAAPERNRIVSGLFIADGERDGASFRIFYGICQNIRDDLLDADFITIEQCRHGFIDLKDELEMLCLRPAADHRHEVI